MGDESVGAIHESLLPGKTSPWFVEQSHRCRIARFFGRFELRGVFTL
jgi:hypothetical protein